MGGCFGSDGLVGREMRDSGGGSAGKLCGETRTPLICFLASVV
jgi:hypothetical protein